MKREAANVLLTHSRVKNQKKNVQKQRKTAKDLDRIAKEGSCEKTKTPSNAKIRTTVTSKSKKLELDPSPEQLEILSVKADNGQVMIEFRATSSTAPSTSGTDCDPKQAKQNGNKVEDEIEFSEPSISALSIPTTDTERHNYQTVPGCSTAIKVEDDVEFCALSDIDQSISENEDEEPNNQTNLNGFTEFKVEDEMEFGATSISVQSISTIDGEPHSNQTIQDEFTETEEEMEFCDDVEIDASNTLEKCGKPKVNEKKSEIICDICSKQYSSISVLNRHRKQHGNPNLYCTICGVAKFTTFELDLHMRTHDTKPTFFTCDICSNQFSTKAYLNKHRLRHGMPNFHCTVCGVAKFTKNELDFHMRTHDTNPIYFTCDICSKKYSTKTNLKKHRMYHDATNGIFFTCDICSYKSSTKSNLKIHRLRHGKPNFHCTVCNVAKFTKNDMDEHMKTHDSNRIYFTCDICSKQYSTKKTLAIHRLRHGKPNFHCPL